MSTCSIPGCTRKYKAKGYCNGHYMSARRYGDPQAARLQHRDFASAWAEFATPQPNGCILWTGALSTQGYAKYNGEYVHRRLWADKHGPIASGIEIDHRCRTRNCVNVDHLRDATKKQNTENHTGATSRSKSGIRGVSWSKQSKVWMAQVRHNGKRHTKYFATLEGAKAGVIAMRNALHEFNDLDR